MKNKMNPELLYYIKGLVFNKSWTWKKRKLIPESVIHNQEKESMETDWA